MLDDESPSSDWIPVLTSLKLSFLLFDHHYLTALYQFLTFNKNVQKFGCCIGNVVLELVRWSGEFIGSDEYWYVVKTWDGNCSEWWITEKLTMSNKLVMSVCETCPLQKLAKCQAGKIKEAIVLRTVGYYYPITMVRVEAFWVHKTTY